MKTGIHVGATMDDATILSAAKAVTKVLQSAYDAHADQETVRHALDTLAKFGRVEHVTISNCHVQG